jgi:integrase
VGEPEKQLFGARKQAAARSGGYIRPEQKERPMLTKAIMNMIRDADVPADEIVAAISALKAAAAARAGKAKSKAISTQAQAEAALAGVHRVKDATGLYLKKGDGGGGSWFHRYRTGGKRRAIGLGALATTTLIEARKRLAKVIDQRNDGKDPIAVRRAAKLVAAKVEAEAAAEAWTFRDAAEDFVAKHASSWKGRNAVRTWFGPVEAYAFPVIGGLPLGDVRVEHVAAIVRAAADKGNAETGRRVRSRVERIINAAVAVGRRDAALPNPASIKLVVTQAPALKRERGAKEHYRRVRLDDAPATFRRLYDLAATRTTYAAWCFMILTASRPSEALLARWDEVDLAKKVWTAPAARMKGAVEHVVPLSSIALAVLELQARRRVGDGDAVFPGRSGTPTAYAGFATAPARAGIDAGAPHGWRSVFSDTAAETLGVDRETRELCLAHGLDPVEGAYRRQSAIEARRPVMEAYALWLADESSDVVAFKARA